MPPDDDDPPPTLNGADGDTFQRLMPLVYEELRRLAGHYLRAERGEHTLQATALVHEAYLRLADQVEGNWQNRAHLLACAALAMRHVLVDYARARSADKRGGGQLRVTLSDGVASSQERSVDLIMLDDALRELARLDERQSRVVELRYFGGLSVEETAEALGVSAGTVKNDWAIARAWLLSRLLGAGDG